MKVGMDQDRKYLRKLMYHITTTHLDMGGKHRYFLRASGFSLVTEIKHYLSKNDDEGGGGEA